MGESRGWPTWAAVAVLVGVLVASTAAGVAGFGGAGPVAAVRETGRVSAPASGYVAAPDGWRWETGAGLQALVPDDWGYGVDLDSPCNRQVDESLAGAVEVPGTHTLVGCTRPEPRSHYLSFLRFDSRGPRAPVRNGRWTTRELRVGGHRVTVRSDEPTVLDRIVRSVSVVDGTDRNGCPLRHPAYADRGWRPTPVTGAATGDPDVLVVCRYGSVDRPADAGLLSFSTVLSPPRTTEVVAGLRSAPAGDGPDAPGACLDGWGDSVAVLRARFPAGWQDYVVRFDGCEHHGLDDGTTARRLTREVARTVLLGYRGPLSEPVFRLTGNWVRDNTR